MTRNWMNRFVAIALLVVGSIAWTGCNTMEGAGKDVEKGGDAIKDAARDAKN